MKTVIAALLAVASLGGCVAVPYYAGPPRAYVAPPPAAVYYQAHPHRHYYRHHPYYR